MPLAPQQIHWIALDPVTSAISIESICRRAIAERIKGVLVPAVFARGAADLLRGTGVSVGSVVSYPYGFSKPTIKAIEATSLAKDGVDSIDLSPLVSHLLTHDWTALRNELLEIARGARAARSTIRLIVRVDTGWVSSAEDWRRLGETVLQGACDGIAIQSLQPAQAAGVVTALGAVQGLSIRIDALASSFESLDGIDAIEWGMPATVEVGSA